jgi:hypothetical protein
MKATSECRCERLNRQPFPAMMEKMETSLRFDHLSTIPAS